MKIVFAVLFLLMMVSDGSAFPEQPLLAAAYARAVAPPIDQVQKLSAIDASGGAQFGRAVSISGDTAVVGASHATVGQTSFQGAAYVYRRINGQWTFEQRLTWEDGAHADEFGASVAIRGDTIMVGAPHARTWQGRVIVFRRTGSVWLFAQVLAAPDAAVDDEFGANVSISGDTAMISSWRDDVASNSDQGSVYVFAKASNGWFQRQKLTAPDGAPGDNFGSVSLSGETAVIGAFQANIGSNDNQGTAYVFTKNGPLWSFAQKLTAADGVASDWFGSAVTIYGGTIVSTSYLADMTYNNQGASYIFTKTGGTWTERQKITVADDMVANGFVVRAINSDTIVAQARRTEAGAEYDRGLSYVFTRAGNLWEFRQRVAAADGTRGDGFGYAAAIFGNTIMYGSLFGDVVKPSNSNEGAAYMFEKSPSAVSTALINGRVLAPNGRPAYPASVTIEDSFGNLRWAHTNPFGYYRFKDVPAGSENTLRVVKKKAAYDSRTTVVETNVSGFDFAALP